MVGVNIESKSVSLTGTDTAHETHLRYLWYEMHERPLFRVELNSGQIVLERRSLFIAHMIPTYLKFTNLYF